MLWALAKFILRHRHHCRGLSFHSLGSTPAVTSGTATLWIHCDVCNSTGGIFVKRHRPPKSPPQQEAP